MSDPQPPSSGDTGELPGLEGHTTEDLVGGWTDAEWAQWFREEVASSERWQRLAERFDSTEGEFPDRTFTDVGHVTPKADFARDPDTDEVDPGLMEALQTFEMLIPDEDDHTYSFSLASSDFDHTFSRLSLDQKVQFFDGWYRVAGEGSPAEPGAGAPAEDAAGPPSEPELHEELRRNFLGGWRRWAVPVVVAGAVVGWLWAGGFGSEDEARDAIDEAQTSASTPDASATDEPEDDAATAAGGDLSVTDPTDDWTELGRDDPPPVDGPTAVDVTGLEHMAGGPWVITFAGDAESAWSSGELNRLAVQLIFIKPDGDSVQLIATYRSSGNPPDIQVSAAQSADKASVTGLAFTWMGDRVEIDFSGFEPPEGTTVNVSVLASPTGPDAVTALDRTDPVPIP